MTLKRSDRMIDVVWQKLQRQISDVRTDGVLTSTRTERAETAGGHPSYTLATAPTTNNQGGDEAWITNGRKSGEGVGAGTGVLAYWNPATSTWKRFNDDSNVVA